MEIALATETAPAQWWGETDETLATALDILDKRAQEMRKARRK